MLDHEGVDSAVGVGHDWGASLFSAAAVFHAGRFYKLAFLAGSHNPPAPFDVDAVNAQSLEQIGCTRFGYRYFFDAWGAADVISNHLSLFFSLAFPANPLAWRDNLCELGSARAWPNVNTTTSLPPWLAPSDKAEWLQCFDTSQAVTAALNYYRSVFAGVQAKNAAGMTREDFVLHVPVMTIAGASDAVSSPEEVQGGSQPWIGARYSAEVVQAGHWVMLEQAEEVNLLPSEFVGSTG